MRTHFTPELTARAVRDFAVRFAAARRGYPISAEAAGAACGTLALARDRAGVLSALDDAARHLLRAGGREADRQALLEAAAAFFGLANWDALAAAMPKGDREVSCWFTGEAVGSDAALQACLVDLTSAFPPDLPSHAFPFDGRGLMVAGFGGEGLMESCFARVGTLSGRHPDVVLTACAVADDNAFGEGRSFRGGVPLGSRRMSRKRILAILDEDTHEGVAAALSSLVAEGVRNAAVQRLQADLVKPAPKSAWRGGPFYAPLDNPDARVADSQIWLRGEDGAFRSVFTGRAGEPDASVYARWRAAKAASPSAEAAASGSWRVHLQGGRRHEFEGVEEEAAEQLALAAIEADTAGQAWRALSASMVRDAWSTVGVAEMAFSVVDRSYDGQPLFIAFEATAQIDVVAASAEQAMVEATGILGTRPPEPRGGR